MKVCGYMAGTGSAPLHEIQTRAATRHGVAWIVLIFSLALHVIDEYLTGFLRFYNETLISRLPLPPLSYAVWLGAAAISIAVLLALAGPVFRGARWALPGSYGFAALMVANGLTHFGASAYYRRPVPGVYSSLLLIAAGANLAICARRRNSAD